MPHRPSREVEALVAGRHGDPFAFLGMHKASAGVYVRAMLPDAERMAVIDTASGEIVAQGERIHPAGFFVASMPDRNAPFRYRLRVWRGGHWHDFDDIYRFPPVLGELDVHLLVEGNHLASYQKLGAHAVLHDGVEGVAFAVVRDAHVPELRMQEAVQEPAVRHPPGPDPRADGDIGEGVETDRSSPAVLAERRRVDVGVDGNGNVQALSESRSDIRLGPTWLWSRRDLTPGR